MTAIFFAIIENLYICFLCGSVVDYNLAIFESHLPHQFFFFTAEARRKKMTAIFFAIIENLYICALCGSVVVKTIVLLESHLPHQFFFTAEARRKKFTAPFCNN